MSLSTVVYEVNLIKNLEWWLIGTSVTRHVYTDKMIFSIHREVDCEQLYIQNSSILKLPGNRRVISNLTYKKLLTLNNVLYIYNMEKKKCLACC